MANSFGARPCGNSQCLSSLVAVTLLGLRADRSRAARDGFPDVATVWARIERVTGGR